MRRSRSTQELLQLHAVREPHRLHKAKRPPITADTVLGLYSDVDVGRHELGEETLQGLRSRPHEATEHQDRLARTE